MRRLNQFVILLSLATSVATTAVAQGPYDDLIVFGQSFTDDGNVFLLTGGRAARPPYFGGRLSNGPLWVEQLAKRLQLGTPTETQAVPAPSLAGGTNYAYGGAATGDGPSTTCLYMALDRVCVPNMALQVRQFLDSGYVLDGDELIVIQPGGNDHSPVVAAHNVAREIFTLALAGGTDFLIPNLFRLRSPAVDPSDPKLDWYVETLDETLQKDLDVLETLLPINIHRLDLLSLSDDLLAHYTDYGFTNVTAPACPACGAGLPAPNAADSVVDEPDEYVYWDWVHFTRPVHELFGNAAADLVGAP